VLRGWGHVCSTPASGKAFHSRYNLGMRVLRFFTAMQVIGLVLADYCLWQFWTHADTFGSKYIGGVMSGLTLASVGTVGHLLAEYAKPRSCKWTKEKDASTPAA
jgi:hypothetical protein